MYVLDYRGVKARAGLTIRLVVNVDIIQQIGKSMDID